ncbi:hypothetical protein TBLA_0A02160 [Henningerozyma blattae CBS 6284]|uniref:Cation efflux protein transmembrane domain-containing protein n=1 Tax=Henningerozyma blattae (strain ATCC 34711 / CBS 6284 / DSM 70876 / NBRC 10599 / NRRL Y-10934 / UCD 77-7) TaxID=1071380 RepID=I2GV65_HENB6|nr:hypothetical protein TBLA_0A02160 [Tetrapisispora blattae CBS 6284]CCH58017.1 hypothetical protein TBLA_0A02160 [Tetrapisispora blattae CBS 6284]
MLLGRLHLRLVPVKGAALREYGLLKTSSIYVSNNNIIIGTQFLGRKDGFSSSCSFHWTARNGHSVLAKSSGDSVKSKEKFSHTHMNESEELEQTHGQSHSHSHSHSEANPMLVLSRDAFKNNPGVRITWIGLGINVAMAAGKAIGGVVFHSQALLADSIHALSDLVSDFLTLFSVGYSTGKATPSYPYGFGKIETVGSLAVSSILAAAGVSIGWTSLCAVVGPIIPHTILESVYAIFGQGHSHSHGVPEDVTNVNAAWIAAASIVAKEWVFQATKKIAISSHSNVLMANAWHHRVDSLTSLVALVTITGGYMFDIQCLDAVGGLIVSGLVIKAGADGIISSVEELIDKALPKSDSRYKDVNDHILNSLKTIEVQGKEQYCTLKNLSIIMSGRNMLLDMILTVPENVPITLQDLEKIRFSLRNDLLKKFVNIKKDSIEFENINSKYSNNLTEDICEHTHEHK